MSQTPAIRPVDYALTTKIGPKENTNWTKGSVDSTQTTETIVENTQTPLVKLVDYAGTDNKSDSNS